MTATKDKIKITGTPPAWDQNEFESRLSQWVHLYHGTDESKELVEAAFEHELLQRVIDKGKAGYTVSPTKRIYRGELNYSVHMIKPEEQQANDIAAIKVKVKAEYIEHLQAERAKFENKLRQQLIQAAEDKERKSAELIKAKQLAAIEKEVQACYKPLNIPD